VHCSVLARLGAVTQNTDGGWTHPVQAMDLLP
jgi:hypothetical protein